MVLSIPPPPNMIALCSWQHKLALRGVVTICCVCCPNWVCPVGCIWTLALYVSANTVPCGWLVLPFVNWTLHYQVKEHSCILDKRFTPYLYYFHTVGVVRLKKRGGLSTLRLFPTFTLSSRTITWIRLSNFLLCSERHHINTLIWQTEGGHYQTHSVALAMPIALVTF